MATDSGISLLSTDTLGKHREVPSTSRQLPKSEPFSVYATPVSPFDTKHKFEDEIRQYG